jgi:hypothetical protein
MDQITLDFFSENAVVVVAGCKIDFAAQGCGQFVLDFLEPNERIEAAMLLKKRFYDLIEKVDVAVGGVVPASHGAEDPHENEPFGEIPALQRLEPLPQKGIQSLHEWPRS